jgi:hypothetical protein
MCFLMAKYGIIRPSSKFCYTCSYGPTFSVEIWYSNYTSNFADGPSCSDLILLFLYNNCVDSSEFKSETVNRSDSTLRQTKANLDIAKYIQLQSWCIRVFK